MELQFNKMVYKSLRKVLCQVLDHEQTQEVRIPESMPDIGRVLGCRGQVVLRTKEWRGDSVSISGGVMAWVMYLSENGGVPKNVEVWIPFQMKWDLPDMHRDGTLCVLPLLKEIDARSVSARKLIIRVNVSVQGEAFEPVDAQIYQPVDLPEDIQILKRNYPLEFLVEAGEKQFQLDDELTIPANSPSIDNVCYFELLPVVTETRIMTDKLLFRGKALFHMLYLADDGSFHCLDQEMSFSQYSHLEAECSLNAKAFVYPIITGLELDLDQEKPALKSTMAAQYMIYDQNAVELVVDAYSPNRDVGLKMETLNLTPKLDTVEKKSEIKHQTQIQMNQIVDIAWLPNHPIKHLNGEILDIEQLGSYQVIYNDEEGNLQCTAFHVQDKWQIPSDPQNSIDMYSLCTGRPELQQISGETSMQVDMSVIASVHRENGLEMVSSLEVGERRDLDPTRPSVILRKVGEASLWDIAKQCGSSIQAIKEANNLCGEPPADQILLVPVC